MSDRIVLSNMVFAGRHGWFEHEQREPQRFEVDLELLLDLAPAAATDDLAATVDYADAWATVRNVVETRSYRLLETLAEAISRDVLAAYPPVDAVVVRVRKPEVDLGGPLDWEGVEIARRRSPGDGRPG